MLHNEFPPSPPGSPGDDLVAFDPPESEVLDEDELARIRLGTDGCPHCDPPLHEQFGGGV
jgi:hypothetical protein